jgi:hypothetical protein
MLKRTALDHSGFFRSLSWQTLGGGWQVTRRLFIKLSTTLVLGIPAAEFLSASTKPVSGLGLQGNEIEYPRLVKIRPDKAVLKWPDQTPRVLGVGDCYREWELVAIIGQPQPLAVLERDFSRCGILVYIGVHGRVATLRKAIGKMDNLSHWKTFSPQYFDRILSAQEDVLGKKALARGGEPSFESIVGLLPPLETYTFLGTKTSRKKVIVWPDGRLGVGIANRRLEKVLFDPALILKENLGERVRTKQGLIGGYLPIIDYAFRGDGAGVGWEEIGFTTSYDGSEETYVSLRPMKGKRTYYHLPDPQPLKDGTAFYHALLSTQQEWERFFTKGMQLAVPDPRVMESSKAAIVRALISEVGLHPKYGVGVYSAKEHDGFPPTTILLNLCLLDWGFIREAKARLAYYLTHFVKQDGTFDYYGPAISEYGQTLAVAARYMQVTQDNTWLRENLPALRRIGDSLIAQMEASRKRNSPNTPYYGLLWGAGEADTRKDKRYYFSSDVWCWRGLVELGRIFKQKGQRAGGVAVTELGKRWLKEAAEFQQVVQVALRRAFEKNTSPPFLPPAVGVARPFQSMTESRFASYTNYRYWLEMLSPGMLAPGLRNAIIAYRTTHGGEMAGTTRFEEALDDWPYANYAWGLLEADQIEHYLLGFYGHMAFHQTPGTFTAYESVKVRGGSTRDYNSDYCVPSQLVVPQLLRWMVAWEPWGKQELWLARAVPRKWFDRGFSANRVPTRWGAVNLKVGRDTKGLTAKVELAPPHPELKVYLRLRPTQRKNNRNVTVEGAKNWKWDANKEVVELWGSWQKAIIHMVGDKRVAS